MKEYADDLNSDDNNKKTVAATKMESELLKVAREEMKDDLQEDIIDDGNNVDEDTILEVEPIKIEKLDDISKTGNNSYMAVRENSINNVAFTNKYERYDDLIVLINERCSLTENS